MPRICERYMETVNTRTYMLVTGGSGGIGAELCKILPTIGIIPIVVYNQNELIARKIAQEAGGIAVHMDMRNSESIRSALDFLEGWFSFGDVMSGVVLAASPPPDVLPFLNVSSQQMYDQFLVNVMGPQFLIKSLIKKFLRKKKSGSIVGVLTEAIGGSGRPTAAGMSSYVVAKSALDTLLSACSVEYPWLKVSKVYPGFTKTRMLDVFDERYLEIIELKKKISSPEEVASEILRMIKL
jgi:NAD(P)-dependent dehydrogenase (short-subunit alcohol dehydrogenase family)